MIKLIGVQETKVYNGEDKTSLAKHVLDTQIDFTIEDHHVIVHTVYEKLKAMFNYNIDPEPSYISGDDMFFTFKVNLNDKLDNKEAK